MVGERKKDGASINGHCISSFKRAQDRPLVSSTSTPPMMHRRRWDPVPSPVRCRCHRYLHHRFLNRRSSFGIWRNVLFVSNTFPVR